MSKSLSKTNGTFTLCKCILGASLVTLPSIIEKLGILLGSAMILFFMTVNVFSLSFIMQAGKETFAENLTEIGGKVNKKYGKGVVTFLLFFTCVVPLIFYINVTVDYFHQVLLYFGCDPGFEVVRFATLLICSAMCVVFRKVDKLQYVSLVGLASLFFLTAYIIVSFVQNFSKINFGSYKYGAFDLNSLEAVSSICFAFCSQFGILSITSNINSTKDCKTVIWTANIISALVYIVTGSLGYFVEPSDNSNFLAIMPINRITVALKFALGIVNISTYPLIMIPTRASLHFFVEKVKEMKSTYLVDSVESFVVVLFAYLCSFPASKYSSFLSCVFFFTGSLVMFALPSYFYAKIVKRKDLLSTCFMYFNYLLTIFGFYMGATGFIKIARGST